MRTAINSLFQSPVTGLGGAWGAGQLVETAEQLRGSMMQQLSQISGSGFGLDSASLLGVSHALNRSHQLISLATNMMVAENRSIQKVIDSIGR